MATTMLILTAAEADALRGPSGPGSALDPRPLDDGTFALPVAVLSDAAHAALQNALQGLQQRDVDDGEWVADPGD